MTDVPDFDLSYSLSCRGAVAVSERGEPEGEGDMKVWASIPLVEEAGKNVELSLTAGEDAGWAELQLYAVHIENTETGRAFHAHLSVDLNPQQLARLHRALALALGEIE